MKINEKLHQCYGGKEGEDSEKKKNQETIKVLG
jgi:hypothetical protein